jgi:hypothetical protein
MKVLDLRCEHGHGFEGWFASGDAFDDQLGRGLVACPVCGTTAVVKLLAAPRLNLSGARAPVDAPAASPAGGTTMPMPAGATGDAAALSALREHWTRAVRHLVASTENVGDRFAEEARRMHYGEVEERAIRGQATRAQAEALHEEGIEVVALPIPPDAKGTLQ